MLAKDDHFENSITVYTYDDDQIIELKCETADFDQWPIFTHCGKMMYKNTFSTNRDQVIEWAIKDAELDVERWNERIRENENELVRRRKELTKAETILRNLEAKKGGD